MLQQPALGVGFVVVLRIEQCALVDGDVDQHTGVAQSLHAAAVGRPAESVHGCHQQRLVARPPAFCQQHRHAPLELLARVDAEQAQVVQAGLQGLRPRRFAFDGALCGGGQRGQACNEFFEDFVAKRLRVFVDRQHLGWQCGGFDNLGAGGIRGGWRIGLHLRGLFLAIAIIIRKILGIAHPEQRRLVRFAQALETGRVVLLVDQLELARIGAANGALVGIPGQRQPLQKHQFHHSLIAVRWVAYLVA